MVKKGFKDVFRGKNTEVGDFPDLARWAQFDCMGPSEWDTSFPAG